jgi:hypothetical protein
MTGASSDSSSVSGATIHKFRPQRSTTPDLKTALRDSCERLDLFSLPRRFGQLQSESGSSDLSPTLVVFFTDWNVRARAALRERAFGHRLLRTLRVGFRARLTSIIRFALRLPMNIAVIESELQAFADAPFDVATFIFGFKFVGGAHREAGNDCARNAAAGRGVFREHPERSRSERVLTVNLVQDGHSSNL